MTEPKSIEEKIFHVSNLERSLTYARSLFEVQIFSWQARFFSERIISRLKSQRYKER
jgi:hypothetical protein